LELAISTATTMIPCIQVEIMQVCTQKIVPFIILHT